jgi:hypothetical protein
MLDDAPTDDGGPPPPAANASTTTATLASTPSTQTTSPALNSGETDSEGVVFAPLRKIWDCIMICQTMVDDTKKGWKCLWCDRVFTPVHATRALTHVLKVKKSDIAPCTAKIQAPYLQRYQDLSVTLSERAAARKRSATDVESAVTEHQEAAVKNLLGRRGVEIPPRSIATMLSATSSKNPTSGCAGTATANAMITRLGGVQPSINASFENMSDIRKCNNASFEMAIADFFHCENIPDKVVESERFARVIKKARTVGSDFKIPSRSKIGGELLDLNFETVYKANKEALLKDASVFGLAFLGDGATIKRMPLMNILGMCAGTPPLTLSIQDCTDHMEEGGKKNAAYIAEMFEAKVNEYDAGNLLTDVFFFDGASNVQKAGEVLTAKFPHTFCFHGAEHVVSLFFSSIARIQPIKVRHSIH